MSETPTDRRPLKTRSAPWARWVAAQLVKCRVSPNGISIAGILIAGVGGALLLVIGKSGFPRGIGLVCAAACVQLRLLCNMLDGLVAVEGGLKSKAGDLFNELPDRLEDTVLLVGAGCAVGCPGLGWFCAVLAILTAYVRALGTALGQPADFRGPGAKPHRMFLLTVGCLGALAYWPVLAWSLVAIAAAALITLIRRTARLYVRLP